LKLEDRALKSVAQFKKKLAPPHEFSEATFRKIDHEIWDLRVAVLRSERAAARSRRRQTLTRRDILIGCRSGFVSRSRARDL
jgi:hypothetical protein